MKVNVVTCGECREFEAYPDNPRFGKCYNHKVKGYEEPWVERHVTDYCSYGIKKEKHNDT